MGFNSAYSTWTASRSQYQACLMPGAMLPRFSHGFCIIHISLESARLPPRLESEVTMHLTERMPRSMYVGFLLALPLAAGTVRIIQTNSAGDDVSIIDPATNKVISES